MALRVFGDDAGFTLHDQHDAQVGWIEGRALGFRCFATLEDARAAARVAYETLASWSARTGAAAPPARIDNEPLHMVNDGAHEWFASGRVPVARLLRPRADVASDYGLHGIELVIPRGIGSVTAIGGAQIIHSALTRQLPDAVVHAAEELDNGELLDNDAAELAKA